MDASRVRKKFSDFCQQNALLAANDRVVVGVSGGADSLCLLHLLLSLRATLNLKLAVAHLNHQLRIPESQADADFVRAMAVRWQLPCTIAAQPVAAIAQERKLSIEETARQVRYAFLWRVASQIGANKVCVGHNADDQAETVLMHFLRGAGLAGLRGMLPATDLEALRLHPADCPAESAQSSPTLIRPLLEISRSEIAAYCQDHKLTPRHDLSNLDTTYFRNRLRHDLIPELENYNPNIRRVLQRTAKVAAADAQLLAELMDDTWARIVKTESPEQITFELDSWRKLPLGLKRSALRRAVRRLRHGLRDISYTHIAKAISVLEKGRTGAQAILPQGLALTIRYQSFTITSAGDPSPLPPANRPRLGQDQVVKLRLPGVTQLPTPGWQLVAEIMPNQALEPQEIRQVSGWQAYLDADVVGREAILRTRRAGDVFSPLGMSGHRKKVNEFMINEKIPAEWRNKIPLLVSNERICWICGYRPDDRASVRPHTKHVLSLRFKPI